MSEEHTKARAAVARQVRIWPSWDEGGDLVLLLNLVKPDGTPSNTVGSCKASDHEELRSLMRGLECGYIIAQREMNNGAT